MIPFPFNENRLSFFFFSFVADYLLVGQLCTNLKSDRSLLVRERERERDRERERERERQTDRQTTKIEGF